MLNADNKLTKHCSCMPYYCAYTIDAMADTKNPPPLFSRTCDDRHYKSAGLLSLLANFFGVDRFCNMINRVVMEGFTLGVRVCLF